MRNTQRVKIERKQVGATKVKGSWGCMEKKRGDEKKVRGYKQIREGGLT